MCRRFTSFLLILCVCWQSLAYAGMDVAVSDQEEQVHAMLHFEGQAHHHNGHDGEFHQDDSPASVQHVTNDACVFAPALLIDAVQPVLTVSSDRPVDACSTEPPMPFLNGPERPPKTLT